MNNWIHKLAEESDYNDPDFYNTAKKQIEARELPAEWIHTLLSNANIWQPGQIPEILELIKSAMWSKEDTLDTIDLSCPGISTKQYKKIEQEANKLSGWAKAIYSDKEKSEFDHFSEEGAKKIYQKMGLSPDPNVVKYDDVKDILEKKDTKITDVRDNLLDRLNKAKTEEEKTRIKEELKRLSKYNNWLLKLASENSPLNFVVENSALSWDMTEALEFEVRIEIKKTTVRHGSVRIPAKTAVFNDIGNKLPGMISGLGEFSENRFYILRYYFKHAQPSSIKFLLEGMNNYESFKTIERVVLDVERFTKI